jgi:hypothetical protein
MVFQEVRVLSLKPRDQRIGSILGVVLVSGDQIGSARLYLFSNFFTRSKIAYTCLLNCSHSVVLNLSRSFEPERTGGAYPL